MTSPILTYYYPMVISATEFKAKCLQILDQVNRTGEVVQVTKHGKVVAELGPVRLSAPSHSGPGCAKGILTIVGDVMSPIDVEWDAL